MKRFYNCTRIVLLFFFFTIGKQGFSQRNTVSSIEKINKLIEQDSLQRAESILSEQLKRFKAEKLYDSLVNYLSVVSSYKLAKNDSKKAIKRTEELVEFIKRSNRPETVKNALIELNNVYATARLFDKNYKLNQEALSYANKIDPIKHRDISQIQYNLGTCAINLNDIDLAKKHLYNSKKILETNPSIEAEQFYLTYNSIGRIKARLLKLDSSSFYYNKSLKALSTMEATPINTYYRAAIVKQNIALNLFNSGKIEESITTIKKAIIDYQSYVKVAENESKKLRAARFRLASVDNLGGFYSGIGDNKSAIEVLTYSYNEKRKTMSDDNPNVILSTLILGHVHLIAKNYLEAGDYIDKGLESIHKAPYYEDYALMIRASVYDNLNDFENAKKIYKKSERLYREEYQNNYSFEFLEALVEMSRFYAKNGMNEKAIQLAEESYNHTNKITFKNLISKFKHTENLAQVYYQSKNYQKALRHSNEALSFNLKMNNALDSIQNEMKKPRALYINAKSRYQLNPTKNIDTLQSLLKQIEQGIKILEQRKTVVNTSEDISLLIEDNNDLFNFAKHLRLDLYQLTNEEIYLNNLLSIHESSIYNRIRSHLNIRNNIAFSNLPNQVIEREKTLKQSLYASLNNTSNIDKFFTVQADWKTFKDSLKLNYPKYYRMRYATIEESLDNLQNNISNNTTLIRYIFIEDELYAFVANKTQKKIIKLDSKNLKHKINDISKNQYDVLKISEKYHDLYKQLWQPFEADIITKNIIIFPDRELFNLSFETLTPTKINTFKELATNSLLSQYSISYNYSLLLLDENKKTINYNSDFIAFAPEFNDEMKDNYRITITDSIDIDNTYLTLLPQPFTADLAKEYSTLFNGSSFTNENASKQVFTTQAKEHKIIHIGTHAESNNVSPELSRLIFAKNVNDTISSEDNSLYTYEIYNQNLSSNLAILTACETGKPTYQAGEGMISLAHAFNYAGSESILTSLWKIDEQSSAKIIEHFYSHLKNGLPKDEALQKAKLDYLATAEGRTRSPQYWAGLVLIGDASPIDLKTSSSLVFWLMGIVLLIIIVVILKNKKA
ncbi:CHAT domain-containing protein [Winogradskyella sp.]|uniref:CHAT domain-containing protein n=1 Tax=Winogradskyella sp. TaxID=1883156 RepID=UPI0025CF3C77|nr:CHAT domain-containing protein [Winogradskyella sp.]